MAYAKLKNGEYVVIWSDNTDIDTIHAYPIEKATTFDVEWDSVDEYPYSDIVDRHNSLQVLQERQNEKEKLNVALRNIND